MQRFIKYIFLILPAFSYANPCQLANQENSFTLALSWLPGICKFNNFSECKEVHKYRFFTLHGLWPEKKNVVIATLSVEK